MSLIDALHIYGRFGFGLKPNEITGIGRSSRADIIDRLFSGSRSTSGLDKIRTAANSFADVNGKSDKAREELLEKSRANMIRTGMDWIGKMVHGEEQLRERMTLFWHGHFASSSPFDKLVRNQNETLRKHALGNFGDLLLAMAHDPMLLSYLDNPRNNKEEPNENFARELLELFSMGEGNYSEKDIKEGARAFTGHSLNFDGSFLFRPMMHDHGSKEFLGRRGRFKGEDIVRIILEEKATARFIARKFYRYFVSEQVDEVFAAELGRKFYSSGYEIPVLIKAVLESDRFYENDVIGRKIKSPLDLVTGLMKQTGVTFNDHAIVVGVLKMLGQIPFHPPNVAGWPVGRQWIDSSNLLIRMRLTDYLLLGHQLKIRGKQPLDMQMMELNDNSYGSDGIRYDLQPLRRIGESHDGMKTIGTYLLGPEARIDEGAYENWLQPAGYSGDLLLLNLFRLPEYQLC